jgi:hypothetical protein
MVVYTYNPSTQAEFNFWFLNSQRPPPDSRACPINAQEIKVWQRCGSALQE